MTEAWIGDQHRLEKDGKCMALDIKSQLTIHEAPNNSDLSGTLNTTDWTRRVNFRR